MNQSLNFGNSTEILYDIITFQRSYFINTNLCYIKNHKIYKGEASTNPLEKENEKRHKIYENILKGSIKNESSIKKGAQD